MDTQHRATLDQVPEDIRPRVERALALLAKSSHHHGLGSKYRQDYIQEVYTGDNPQEILHWVVQIGVR